MLSLRTATRIIRLRAQTLRTFASESGGDKKPGPENENKSSEEKSVANPSQIELRKDWLPAERPWEAGYPAHERIKYPEVQYPDFNVWRPSVNDQLPPVELMDPTLSSYKYPQFILPPPPIERISENIKADIELVKQGKIKRKDFEVISSQVDVVIIGGGIIGTSIAYMLKARAPDSYSVMVVEKDSSYTHSATCLSAGGFRQQFSVKENIQMAQFTADFLRNAKRNLAILDDEPPDIKFSPHGYLFLAREEDAEEMLHHHSVQINNGAYVDILNRDQLRDKFPWLNTEGICIAANGVENEGWFDPTSLLIAMRGKAEFTGAQFVEAEFLDFNLEKVMHSEGVYDDTGEPMDRARFIIIRLPDGSERHIRFGFIVMAAGAETAEIAHRCLKIGHRGTGIRSIPLPIQKRKRYIYVFNCPNGPGLDFPYLVDPSGVWVRREGLGGNYICGKTPSPDEEPSDSSNYDVDYNFFEQKIWPVLRKRVAAFHDIKIVSAWSTFHDVNYLDGNPVIGCHPYFWNIVFAAGFSGASASMAPAVGRAVTELLVDKEYTSINLERLGWSRIFSGYPLTEQIVVN